MLHNKGQFLVFLIGFLLMASVAMAEMTDREVAKLRGLDKVSGRIQTFEVPIDQTVRFGQNLYVRIRACRKSDPIDPPEAAAFMEVWEKDINGDKSEWVFSGWVFASSPALSAMDHAVYDVWVIDCKNESTTNLSEENDTAEPGSNESSEPEADVDDEAESGTN